MVAEKAIENTQNFLNIWDMLEINPLPGIRSPCVLGM